MQLACPKCKSTDLSKFGLRWILDKNSNNHHKIRIQQYSCNSCGRITIHPFKSQNRDGFGRFIGKCAVSTPKASVVNPNASGEI